MSAPVIRVVILDIGGVLVSEEPVAPHLQGVLARHDPEERLTTGHLDEEWMRATFQGELGLSDADADQFMLGLWDWYCGTLDRRMFDWAVALRERLPVAMLSNSVAGARREEEARYGLSSLFEPIIYSHEVGFAKPDERIYRLACQLLGVEPTEVVFVDDRRPNVAAAAAIGMLTVHHTGTEQTIRAVEALLASREQG
jgi:FMN phosphatase YigB (HAD superfamily)